MFILVNKICHEKTVEPRVVNTAYIHHIKPASSGIWGDHCGIYFSDEKIWWNVVEDYETIASKLMCE